MKRLARTIARLLAACCVAALLTLGLPGPTRAASDIGENNAIVYAYRELSRQIDTANQHRPAQARPMTLESLLRYHTLTAMSYDNPANACLYQTLLAGLVGDLEPWQKMRDERLKKELTGKMYYLVAFEPDIHNTAVDGGRYCVYVDTRSGQIIRYDALLG